MEEKKNKKIYFIFSQKIKNNINNVQYHLEKNDAFDNIEIGTFHENSMDRCEEQRKLQAKHASRFNMVYTDDDVVKIKDFYAATRSYKQTMEKFGISSKATLHNILHNR